MIISVQNQKGGVGKTTLAIHISHVLASKDGRVLLIDADPQGSARDWAAARASQPPFTVVAVDRPTIHRDIPTTAQGYRHVVIDGPPRVTDLARSAIIAADLVVIPIQPSPYDVWAAKDVVDLIREASVFKEKLKSVFAINRKIANTAIGRDVAEALSSYNIPVLKSQICQRVAFAESAATGQTVLETVPNSAAAIELKALAQELLEVGRG
ncbi:MAG: AAA family ATPase [Leptolyngbyaceae cyanobacterium CRU_2_3]|nr:AAA family ATPase [Leptolyngbyaceae cyanobacterium CRU_2_3]